MVSAKSGTSLERETSSKSGITLFQTRSAAERQKDRSGQDIPDKSDEQPDQPKRPPNRVVSSNALPVKDEVEREVLACDKGSEKN